MCQGNIFIDCIKFLVGNIMKNKLITVVTPIFNEEDTVVNCYKQVKNEFSKLPYDYEHIFIDNASVDKSIIKIKNIIKTDKNGD